MSTSIWTFASKLPIRSSVLDTATRVFDKFKTENPKSTFANDLLVPAVIYIAARMDESCPLSLLDICQHFKCNVWSVGRYVRIIKETVAQNIEWKPKSADLQVEIYARRFLESRLPDLPVERRSFVLSLVNALNTVIWDLLIQCSESKTRQPAPNTKAAVVIILALENLGTKLSAVELSPTAEQRGRLEPQKTVIISSKPTHTRAVLLTPALFDAILQTTNAASSRSHILRLTAAIKEMIVTYGQQNTDNPLLKDVLDTSTLHLHLSELFL